MQHDKLCRVNCLPTEALEICISNIYCNATVPGAKCTNSTATHKEKGQIPAHCQMAFVSGKQFRHLVQLVPQGQVLARQLARQSAHEAATIAQVTSLQKLQPDQAIKGNKPEVPTQALLKGAQSSLRSLC